MITSLIPTQNAKIDAEKKDDCVLTPWIPVDKRIVACRENLYGFQLLFPNNKYVNYDEW